MLRCWSGLQCFASFIFLNVGATQQARTGLQGEWRLFFSRRAAYSCFKALLKTSCMNIFAIVSDRFRIIPKLANVNPLHIGEKQFDIGRIHAYYMRLRRAWAAQRIQFLTRHFQTTSQSNWFDKKNRTDRTDKGPDLSSPLSLPLTLPLLITQSPIHWTSADSSWSILFSKPAQLKRASASSQTKKTSMMDLNLIIMYMCYKLYNK